MTKDDRNDEIIARLTSLQSEFAQLSELGDMERNFLQNLVDSLKVLQSGIDVAMPIGAGLLKDYHGSPKEVFLLPEGVVMVVEEDGTRRFLPLLRFSTRDVLSIMQELAPQLEKAISVRRKDVGSRVEVLERILGALKKARNMMKAADQGMADVADEDLLQKSIAGE